MEEFCVWSLGSLSRGGTQRRPCEVSAPEKGPVRAVPRQRPRSRGDLTILSSDDELLLPGSVDLDAGVEARKFSRNVVPRVHEHRGEVAHTQKEIDDKDGPASEAVSVVSCAKACPAPFDALGHGRIATRIRPTAPKRLRLMRRVATRVSQVTTVLVQLHDECNQNQECAHDVPEFDPVTSDDGESLQ